jgi:hypothetical protein
MRGYRTAEDGPRKIAENYYTLGSSDEYMYFTVSEITQSIPNHSKRNKVTVISARGSVQPPHMDRG